MTKKERIEIVKKILLRRFLRKKMYRMNYVNRQNVTVKKMDQKIVKKAIDELIKSGFFEVHHKNCVSINLAMLKEIYKYLEENSNS